MSVLSVSGVLATEASTQATFKITLDQASSLPVTFGYFLSDGSASQVPSISGPQDYRDASGTLTIAPGQTSITLNTVLFNDHIPEGNETFFLTLYGVTNATFAGGAAALQATGTIIDSTQSTTPGVGADATQIQGPPSASAGGVPTIRVYNTTNFEGSGGVDDQARFLVVLDKAATAPVSVSYVTNDGSATAASQDYRGVSGTLTIAAGQRSGYIEVSFNGADSLVEGNENFQLILTNPVNAVLERGASALVATSTIIDNDSISVTGVGGLGGPATLVAPPASASTTLPTINAFNVALSEATTHGSNSINFLVTLNRPATSTVTLNYEAQDGTATGTSQGFAGDYQETSGTLTFAPGQQTQYITVPNSSDSVAGLNKTVLLVLSGAQGAVFAGNAPALVATGTIIDDDGPVMTLAGGLGGPAAQVQSPADVAGALPVLQVVSTSTNEGQHPAGVYLVLSHASANATTVHVVSTDGSATGSASGDYSPVSLDFTIPAGSRSAYVPVSIKTDTKIEGDESFSLTFSNLQGATFAGGGSSATATVTIRDDDGGGTAGVVTSGPQFTYASVFAPAVESVLRSNAADGTSAAYAMTLQNQVASGAMTTVQAYANIAATAISTTSVATLAYEFFTGQAPGNAGMDYLVSATGPNANNLNGAYYQSFSLENRYINFAVNLGKGGEGAAAFTAKYGSLSLFEATRQAYATIFGDAPSDAKLHAILDPTTVLNGVTYTRAGYFAYYGLDGPDGIGTKAAMVGYLLAEAEKADLGMYAKSNDALLADVAVNGAPFGVDLVGVYGQASYVFHPG